MDLLGALCLSLAIISLGAAVVSRPGASTPLRSLIDRATVRHSRRLQQARVIGCPHSMVAMTVAVPTILFAAGWLESPVLAILGGAAGMLVPRLYLSWLVHAQARRSEDEAPRLLQSLLASLTAGCTYLDTLRQARRATTDRWIREDLDFVIQRFLLDVPLHDSMRERRAHIATRNLALVWETLIVCSANQLPTQAARTLLYELSATVQFNVQLANEVRAKTSGQRVQIWLLAVIVPAMYLYLRLVSPDLLGALDQTPVGRYLLVPAAAVLEVLGIYLSFRVARFAA